MQRRPRTSFTLIELLVVLALLSLAAGMTVTRYDGLSASGRLRSAASQMVSWMKLGCREARLAGEPRLVLYEQRSMTLRKPIADGSAWRWDEGRKLPWPHGVVLQPVLHQAASDAGFTIAIAPNGRVPSHAVVLGAADQGAVAVFQGGQSRIEFPSRPVQATTFEALLVELAHANETPERTDAH